MRFEFFIGRRYLRARQKQAFISLISILSTAGVTVGVMALIVVIAVMSFYIHPVHVAFGGRRIRGGFEGR